MKQKDLMYLMLAVVILLVAGYVGYTQLLPKKASSGPKTVQVDKIGVIPASLSTEGSPEASGLKWINDDIDVVDYDSAVDLTGLGNTAPFGQ